MVQEGIARDRISNVAEQSRDFARGVAACLCIRKSTLDLGAVDFEIKKWTGFLEQLAEGFRAFAFQKRIRVITGGQGDDAYMDALAG